MTDRVPTRCDQCGQVDTDPKHHSFGGATKHHDCLSVDEEREIRESAQPESQVATSAIIEKCKGGTKGDALLKFIVAEQAKTDKRES